MNFMILTNKFTNKDTKIIYIIMNSTGIYKFYDFLSRSTSKINPRKTTNKTFESL